MRFSQNSFSIFGEVMTEHPDWEFKNFGKQPPIKPMLGMQEELGELTHPVLKFSQGVRITSEAELKDRIRDAIGDTLVYLISYANKVNIHLIQVMHDHERYIVRMMNDYGLPDSDTIRKEKLDMPMWAGYCLGRLWIAQINGDMQMKICSIAALLVTLDNIALEFLGENIGDCLKRAWDEVKKRDWKYNPWNGQAALL